MAYFRKNEPYKDEKILPEAEVEDYNDGFDEPEETEEEFPVLSEEEKKQRRKNRARIAIGAGNLLGVIAGTILIMVLLTLIFSIIHFVINDMGRNFSLFQTNF